MTTHRAFVSTVRDISRTDWGSKFETAEKAAADLMKSGVDLSSAALLELVRRLNVVTDALANDSAKSENADRKEKENRKPDAKTLAGFPGIAIGDSLYSCDDLDDGVCRLLVVFVEEGTGHCRLVHVGDDDGWTATRPPFWACGDYYRTPELALAEAARRDVGYHEPGLKLAREVLDELAAGRDVSRFFNPGDSEDDAT